jgi:hypothetical protein
MNNINTINSIFNFNFDNKITEKHTQESLKSLCKFFDLSFNSNKINGILLGSNEDILNLIQHIDLCCLIIKENKFTPDDISKFFEYNPSEKDFIFEVLIQDTSHILRAFNHNVTNYQLYFFIEQLLLLCVHESNTMHELYSHDLAILYSFLQNYIHNDSIHNDSIHNDSKISALIELDNWSKIGGLKHLNVKNIILATINQGGMVLTLSNLNLKSLPLQSILILLPNITMIDVSNNDLTEIILTNGYKLKKLNISNNPLVKIELKNLPSLDLIDLAYNNWEQIKIEVNGINKSCCFKMFPNKVNQLSRHSIQDSIAYIKTRLNDSSKSRNKYNSSEIKELVNNFIKRMTSTGYLDNYVDNSNRVIDIASTIPQNTVVLINKFKIIDRNFFVNNDLEFLQNKYLINHEYKVDDSIEPILKEVILSAMPSEVERVYIDEMSIDYKPTKLAPNLVADIIQLEEFIDNNLKHVRMTTENPTNQMSKERNGFIYEGITSTNVIATSGVSFHGNIYDRYLMLRLFLALKEKKHLLFIDTMVRIISGVPNNLSEQRNAFKYVFTHLFVTRHFPSYGVKILYQHFLGRCGQIY